MAIVELDKIDGATASHHVIQGWSITRLAVVHDMDWSNYGPQLTTMKVFETALNLLMQVTGERGSPCPDVSVPTYLEQFIPEAISPAEVKIRVVYKGYPLPKINFTSSLNQVETNLDADGNPIFTEYLYPIDYGINTPGDPKRAAPCWPVLGGGVGVPAKQGATISRPTPEITYTVEMTITSGLNSVTDLLLLEGGVNQDPYPVGTIPGKPATWMVSNVSARSPDGGFSYEMSFSLQYREETWDPFIAFVNPDDGKPPKDLIKNVGYKTVKGPRRVKVPAFVFGPN